MAVGDVGGVAGQTCVVYTLRMVHTTSSPRPSSLACVLTARRIEHTGPGWDCSACGASRTGYASDADAVLAARLHAKLVHDA